MKKRFVVVMFAGALISGCSNQPDVHRHSGSDSENMYQRGTFSSASSQGPNIQLQDYVKELVAQMAMNMRSVDASGTIAVTNFVAAARDYKQTNELSFTLAEAFMSELHQFGLTTLDYKVADFIRVTPNGDFVMSRDYLELKESIAADYVLVGTYSSHRKGLLVHARIVDLDNKAVVATGESLIPVKQVRMLTGHMGER